MARPLCPACGSRTIQKWGKTSSGAQRWRCGDCKGAFTPRIDNSAKRLDEFLGWLLSKGRQADRGILKWHDKSANDPHQYYSL